MRPPLIHLPANSIQVTDADEEIFLLYSEASEARLRTPGLGSLDSRKDEIVLSIEVSPPGPGSQALNPGSLGSLGTKTNVKRQGEAGGGGRSKTVEVELVQDVTGLRSRTGDTGSVIWRASVEFAKHLLADCLFPSPLHSVFSASHLKDADVLELGAGTGVLSILLAPYTKRYVATDLAELVPLIWKNIHRAGHDATMSAASPPGPTRAGHGHKTSHPHSSRRPKLSPRKSSGGNVHVNGSAHATSAVEVNITAQELDWLAITSTAPGSRARARARGQVVLPSLPRTDQPSSSGVPDENDGATGSERPTEFDLILAVDTLYNTALVPSFVAVLNEFASPSVSGEAPTLVIVVCELRDEDVLRCFLEEWLALTGWEIWRLGSVASGFDDVGGEEGEGEGAGVHYMDGPFVAWAGWKVPI